MGPGWWVDEPVLRIRNLTRAVVLAEQAHRARTFGARLKGLMFSPGPRPGEALVIEPCTSVHTCFMRVPIDVLLASREGRVLGVVHGLRPWRLSPWFPRARYVVELPAGTLRLTGTAPGDELLVEEKV